jgi:hypothetical protein
MWRNTPKVNRIFMRSVNWKDMASKGNEIFAFDEHTRPDAPGEESVDQVLVLAHDIRQCCHNTRSPTVKRGNDTTFVADMFDRFATVKGGNLYLNWQRGQGLYMTLDGPFAHGEQHRRESQRPLFFHFLQWKYCCGSELTAAIAKFTRDLELKGVSVFNLNCFNMHVSEKTFTFSECN